MLIVHIGLLVVMTGCLVYGCWIGLVRKDWSMSCIWCGAAVALGMLWR